MNDEALYIDDWNSVPDGDVVVEDTYPEVYVIFTREGKRWLRQIGWQGKARALPKHNERIIDFEPNCTWDQPWIWLKTAKMEDYILKTPEVSSGSEAN